MGFMVYGYKLVMQSIELAPACIYSKLHSFHYPTPKLTKYNTQIKYFNAWITLVAFFFWMYKVVLGVFNNQWDNEKRT